MFAGDNQKLSYAREVATWYNNIAIQQNHAHVVRARTMEVERSRMPDLHCQLIENLIRAMEEARDSSDPYKRSRWYMYQGREQLCPVDYEVERVVPMLPLMPMEMEPSQMEQRQQMQEVETCTSTRKKKKQLCIQGPVHRLLCLQMLQNK